jgi:putative transposase
MYRWRKMSAEQRLIEMKRRQAAGLPMHSPRHCEASTNVYLISASCYEHRPHIARSDQRLDEFSEALTQTAMANCERIDAWVVLPNHHHLLVCCQNVLDLLRSLGKHHGRTSHQWNGEECCRGRKVWFNALERPIFSERHHIAAMQYVHHNPVKHGYVSKWTDWNWSSAREYIEKIGIEEAERRWREYPVLAFGKGWDD